MVNTGGNGAALRITGENLLHGERQTFLENVNARPKSANPTIAGRCASATLMSAEMRGTATVQTGVLRTEKRLIGAPHSAVRTRADNSGAAARGRPFVAYIQGRGGVPEVSTRTKTAAAREDHQRNRGAFCLTGDSARRKPHSFRFARAQSRQPGNRCAVAPLLRTCQKASRKASKAEGFPAPVLISAGLGPLGEEGPATANTLVASGAEINKLNRR